MKELEKLAIPEELDLTAGEIEELHNMNEWEKITKAFLLGYKRGRQEQATSSNDNRQKGELAT